MLLAFLYQEPGTDLISCCCSCWGNLFKQA